MVRTSFWENSVLQSNDIETGVGILVSVQKPGKVNEPFNNLRPVILLPIMRKILSNIVLERTRSEVDEFLPKLQSSYRQHRRTFLGS